MTTQMLVVEQHDACRRAVDRLVASAHNGLRIAAQVATSADAAQVQDRIDLVLMSLDGTEDISALGGLRALFDAPILVLSQRDDAQAALEALRAGATGFVPTRYDPQHLLAAMYAVAGGEPVVLGATTAEVAVWAAAKLGDVSRASERLGILTPREQEVLTLLSEGMTARRIAAELFVSRRTVERHLYNAYRKLDVHGRIEAINSFRTLKAAVT